MKILNWLFVLLGVAGLVGVRFFEDQLFYDPLLAFFHKLDKHAPLPDIVWSKLIISHLFRFSLNLLFTLVIVHFLFLRKAWTIQAAVLMILVFLVTFPLYLYCVYTDFKIGFLFSFYIRRFVIQPLIILLIIPLFYYRKSLEKLR